MRILKIAWSSGTHQILVPCFDYSLELNFKKKKGFQGNTKYQDNRILQPCLIAIVKTASSTWIILFKHLYNFATWFKSLHLLNSSTNWESYCRSFLSCVFGVTIMGRKCNTDNEDNNAEGRKWLNTPVTGVNNYLWRPGVPKS